NRKPRSSVVLVVNAPTMAPWSLIPKAVLVTAPGMFKVVYLHCAVAATQKPKIAHKKQRLKRRLLIPFMTPQGRSGSPRLSDKNSCLPFSARDDGAGSERVGDSCELDVGC